MVAATYGFVSAFGQNIALIPTLTTGMKWFPDNKGKCKISWYLIIIHYGRFIGHTLHPILVLSYILLGTVMGIIVGGFGGGAMVFNQVQTKILNPDNVPVTLGGYLRDVFSYKIQASSKISCKMILIFIINK